MKKHLHKPYLEHRKGARHRDKLSYKGCASRQIQGGEKSQENVCVGWGFSASVLFFVKQPSEKAPEKAE